MSNDRQQRAARAEQMRKEREKADRKQRNLITIGIVAIVVVLIAVAGYAITDINKKNKTVDEVINPKNTTKDFGVAYDTEVATGKAATDPVQVVAYEDFQCPACRSFEEQSGAFLNESVAKGDITVEYRPISFLDSQSNGNRFSSRAGSAAMCVLDDAGVKKFKEMHAALFVNQPEEGANGMPDSGLIDLAKQVGVTGIDSCIKSERFVPWIEEATEASRKEKVDSTPTVLVAGKKVEAPTPEALQTAITAAKKS